MKPDVRKGQWGGPHPRDEFRERFRARFFDPAFRAEDEAITRLEAIAWRAYVEGRKAPVTRKAGAEFRDPDYDLSVEWVEARNRILAAQARWADGATRSRVLVIACAPRNDGTCSGEMSRTFRLARIACDTLGEAGLVVDLLDLSGLTSDFDRHIHPCKGCVSTAMPLCHWPCSCYPNHATNQVNDWMNEIYERWTAAHGVLLLTPTHWYAPASPLKLMMDRPRRAGCRQRRAGGSAQRGARAHPRGGRAARRMPQRAGPGPAAAAGEVRRWRSSVLSTLP